MHHPVVYENLAADAQNIHFPLKSKFSRQEDKEGLVISFFQFGKQSLKTYVINDTIGKTDTEIMRLA